MPEPGDRGRRREHQQRAYELQLLGGLQGMARWTVYGLIGVGLAHRFWPLFRKQTWGLKAFLVSSASMSGLVIGADDYLLRYESAQRDAENVIRREARNALAARGIIATETEIRRWREERRAERERASEVDVLAASAVEGEMVDSAVMMALEEARNEARAAGAAAGIASGDLAGAAAAAAGTAAAAVADEKK